MTGTENIAKVAIDCKRGRLEHYSQTQARELLRRAVRDLNGGSDVITYRTMRDGRQSGLFSLIEEVLSATVCEGLSEDEFFMNLVDFRNVALGDKNLFLVEDSRLLTVSEAAEGTRGLRRQRLTGVNEVTIPTSLKAVKIYEELGRVVSGRTDFDRFIDLVTASVKQRLLEDVYTLWSELDSETLGGGSYYTAGAYDADELLELIAHVEAAAGGRTATITGTKKALRNLEPSIQGTDSERDIYNMGYYGRFYGSPVLAMPQRHKAGSTEFIISDDIITVIAGDDKPIKVVYEGDPIIEMGNPMATGDMTCEYFYGERYGMALVMAGTNSGIGRYELA